MEGNLIDQLSVNFQMNMCLKTSELKPWGVVGQN